MPGDQPGERSGGQNGPGGKQQRRECSAVPDLNYGCGSGFPQARGWSLDSNAIPAYFTAADNPCVGRRREF